MLDLRGDHLCTACAHHPGDDTESHLELAFDDVPDLVLRVVAAVRRRLPRRPAFTDDVPRRPSSK